VTPSKYTWSVDNETTTNIEKALARLDKDIRAHTVNVIASTGYGKNTIKKWKVSPDSFVQMAMQLAYYRTYGTVGATYESGATRRFRHGRTETCRSVSIESVDFVSNFDKQGVSVSAPFIRLKYRAKCSYKGRGQGRAC